MASTYSTSLRLELMATGDQSGTWGTTTNGNLGTLLEQSITGVLSVAQGDVANLTLTTVNGGSDQARNAVVNLTGALTAQRNVVVQTANKLYLIKNSTTGGFSIIAKTAAGTGVTILPGTSQWVYSDGTNVVAGLIGNGAPDANGNISANNFLVGYTTSATTGGTTVLNVASTELQYFTGVTTQTITLPVVSTLVLGQEFEIVNLSTGSLTVNSSGGNLVVTVGASSSVRVQAILVTGTSAASWNAISVNLSGYLPLAGGTMTGPLINTGSSVGYTPFQAISTEAAAAAGPIYELYRNSASPAANDILGQLIFYGKDSAANKQEYASIQAVVVDPTSTSEDASLDIYIVIAGVRTLIASVGATLTLPNAPMGVASGGTGLATLTANNVLLGNGTSAPSFVAPSTSGNVLTSNGTTWQSTAPAAPGMPIPTSDTLPLGFAGFLGRSGGGTTANGSTTAGSNISISANGASGTFDTDGGSAQTGTWRNISGVSLGATSYGLWVRTA